jgi:HSP20 family protein
MTTNLIRISPNADIFRGSLDRLFNSMLADVYTPTQVSEGLAARTWTPAVDIRETADALIVEVELPGVVKENVHLALENQILTISGERQFEKQTENETYHRVERAYGSFTRAFTLPAHVATEKVEATFERGILTVKLPKMEEAKPKKIAIK